MESQLSVTVWEPLFNDFGTLVQKEFESVDEAVRYAMETIPEPVRHVAVISRPDGTIIGPGEIHQRYGDLGNGPERSTVEAGQAGGSTAGRHPQPRCLQTLPAGFGIKGLMQRLRPAMRLRAAA